MLPQKKKYENNLLLRFTNNEVWNYRVLNISCNWSVCVVTLFAKHVLIDRALQYNNSYCSFIKWMALEEKLYGKCYFTFYGIISVMLRRQCLASNVGLMLMFLSLHRFASHLILIICNVLAACFENLVNHTSIQLIWRHNCIFIYKKTSSGSFYFHFNWWFIYKLYVEN